MFFSTKRYSRAGLLLGCLLGMTGVAAQNLVTNGDFNAPIVPPSWTPSTDGMCNSCSVAVDNTNGQPTIPSARLVSSHPGNAGQLLSSPCIAYGSGIYDVGAFRRINSASANAQGTIEFYFWSNATCDSGYNGTAPLTTLGTVGTWEQIGVTNFDPPGASGFFVVVLQARLNGAIAGTANYSFDHVYFNKPDPIFSNGFEN